MKLKLLAIGVVALMLCAVLPMSVATAAPTKTTITVPVYVLTYEFGGGNALVGPVVGKITYDVTTRDYALTVSKLQPAVSYELGITTSGPPDAGSPVELVFLDPTNAHGRLHETGTIDSYYTDSIATALGNGGVFVVFTP